MDSTNKQKVRKRDLQAIALSLLIIFGITVSTTSSFESRPTTIDNHFWVDMLVNLEMVLVISFVPFLFFRKKYSYWEIFGGSTIIYFLIVLLLVNYK